MRVLGIDTATSLCGVALAVDGRIAASASAGTPQAHAERLLGLIGECLPPGAATPRPDALAVSSGPGSFTGLRIGFSTAKGICFAAGCALVAVPTFDAWAFGAVRTGLVADGARFLAVMSAGREDAYVAAYRNDSGRAATLVRAAVVPLGALPAFAAEHPGAAILTDRPAAAESWFGRGSAGPMLAVGERNPAEWIALLGAAMFAAGLTADLRTAEPAYLKDFSTLRKQ